MPFNGSGIFSIVNSFAPGTTISSSAMNANFSDIATGLSDVLTRDGQAGMTAALKIINGNTSVPALAFSSEPTLGLYRAAAATLGVAGSLSVVDDVAVAGALTVAGSPYLPIGLGPLQWSGATAPAGWVLTGATYNRADYPDLWTFAQDEIAAGNLFYTNGNGTTTFTIATMEGYTPAGVDPAAARIGSFTHIGNTAGSSTATLVAGNLPPYTPAGTVSISNVQVAYGARQYATSGSSDVTKFSLASNVGADAGTLTSASGSATGSFTGTATSGASTPFSIVHPVRAFKYIVYAGV